MKYARMIGTGGYLPKKILTNAELEKLVTTSDEWIKRRVGISERHIIDGSDDNTSTMALKASKQAIEAAGISVQKIDMIIVGTATPQYFFPSVACLIQKGLNIKTDIPAFDLNAACAGFIYCLSVANQYIKSGTAKTVLVVGVDSLTKLIDWTDPSTCVLFGDGAGAVILQADRIPGILSMHIHANGCYSELIISKTNIWNKEKPSNIRMRGSEVFKIAVKKLGDIVDKTIAESKLKKSDIDWLIPHQANLRIIRATAKRLSLPMERVILTIEHHGNTSAASIPLALDHAVRRNQIKAKETLLLEAFGAGIAWGAALLKY